MFNETVYGDGGLRPRRRYGLESGGLSDSIITEGGRQYRLWEKDGISYRTDLGPVPVSAPTPAPVPEVIRDTRIRRPKRYGMRRYQPRPRFVPQPRKRIRFDIHPLPPIRVIPPGPGLHPLVMTIPGRPSKVPMPQTGGVKCPTGFVPLGGRCVKAPRFDIHPLPPTYNPYNKMGLSGLDGCGCESGGEASGAGFDSIPNWVLIGGVVFAAAMVLKKR